MYSLASIFSLIFAAQVMKSLLRYPRSFLGSPPEHEHRPTIYEVVGRGSRRIPELLVSMYPLVIKHSWEIQCKWGFSGTIIALNDTFDIWRVILLRIP
jgi:hypothetical protein